jgi:hypothetical protein
MISWFNKIQEQRQEAARRKRLAELQAAKAQKLARVREVEELRLITINNIRYIRSAINVFNSVVNTVKGQSAAETKKRRIAAQAQLKWYKLKLPEEEAMLNHWQKMLKNLQ